MVEIDFCDWKMSSPNHFVKIVFHESCQVFPPLNFPATYVYTVNHKSLAGLKFDESAKKSILWKKVGRLIQ